jgi:hypothetical protein
VTTVDGGIPTLTQTGPFTPSLTLTNPPTQPAVPTEPVPTEPVPTQPAVPTSTEGLKSDGSRGVLSRFLILIAFLSQIVF